MWETLWKKWGDLQLQQEQNGDELLVWVGEPGTKTRTGQKYGHQRQRAFLLKAYATGYEKCPVKLYGTSPSARSEQTRCAISLHFCLL